MVARPPLPLNLVIDRCRSMRELKQIHGHIFTSGLSDDSFLISKLLLFSAVSKSGDIHYSHKLFFTIPNPNTFVWNTLIRGFSTTKNPNISISIYVQMLRCRTFPNHLTFPFLAKSCAYLRDLALGMSVHCQSSKLGLDLDLFVQNSLIHMYASCGDIASAREVFNEMPVRNTVSRNSMIDGYAKCGNLASAQEVFDVMPERDVVSWSALIDGHVKGGEYSHAITLFERMQNDKVKANSVTMVSLLCACAHLGALDQGRKLHSYIKENGLDSSLELSTSLIDMYAKCGSIEEAINVFNSVPFGSKTDVLFWNAMIGGLAMHGLTEESCKMYRKMQKFGIEADEITYLALLSAYAHGGLVDDAWTLWRFLMAQGIAPQIEHYACMVDILGRCGRVEEAYGFVKTMPIEPSASVLGALLSACGAHGWLNLAEIIGKKLVELEPDHDGRYVGLSNIFAFTRRWKDAKEMREKMEKRGVKKAPGYSILELDSHVHRFIAHDKTHPHSSEIYIVLNIIIMHMTVEPDSDDQEVLYCNFSVDR